MNPSNETTGPFWPEPIRVLSVTASSYGFITVEARGTQTGRHYTTILSQEQWAAFFHVKCH